MLIVGKYLIYRNRYTITAKTLPNYYFRYGSTGNRTLIAGLEDPCSIQLNYQSKIKEEFTTFIHLQSVWRLQIEWNYKDLIPELIIYQWTLVDNDNFYYLINDYYNIIFTYCCLSFCFEKTKLNFFYPSIQSTIKQRHWDYIVHSPAF